MNSDRLQYTYSPFYLKLLAFLLPSASDSTIAVIVFPGPISVLYYILCQIPPCVPDAKGTTVRLSQGF